MSKRELYITLGLIAFTAFNLASPSTTRAQSTCPPEQRKELILTAVDKEGSVIEKLRAANLSLKAGGAAATISDVVFHATYPLDLVVVIDASASQERVLPAARAAARAFVSAVASAGEDRVAVVSFSEKPNYLQVLTTDLTAAGRAIDQVRFEPPPGYVGGGAVVSTGPTKPGPVPGSTSLWDVIRSATTELFDARPDGRRRTMLLFTDGTDTSSASKLNRAIEDANKYDLSVFVIGLADTENFLLEEEPLKKLSEQTGGIVRFPGKKKEKLEAALTEIARHFRGNYVVGYCGGAAKDRAKLQLEIVDPEIRKAKPVLAYKRY